MGRRSRSVAITRHGQRLRSASDPVEGSWTVRGAARFSREEGVWPLERGEGDRRAEDA